ncbi:MAG: hypothetical protein JWL76_87 [Thermoleophilia bacterium]|nr:hypothetical protein [Thermoleophilia bacterium]
MLVRRISTLAALLVALAVPTAAMATESTTTTTAPSLTAPAPVKAHGLLNAANQFDRHAARLTKKADELQAAAATLRNEAAATTPADEHKLRNAERLDAQAARLDKQAARFTARAVAFRAKAATRLTKVDDDADAADQAKRAHGLLNAATKQRALAATATADAAKLRTEAAATTPADPAKLEDAAKLDVRAARHILNAVRLEAHAALLAAAAEQKAAV